MFFSADAPSSPIWMVVDKPVLAFKLVDRFIGRFAGLLLADDVGTSATVIIITSDSEVATEQVFMN